MKKLFSLLLLAVTFMATAQVANDDCSNAIQLQINLSLTPTLQTSGTIAGATASPEANTCAGADDDDVWYQFTATSTSHQINITNISGSTTDLNHVVYAGNDCGTLIQIYCSNPNSSSANELTIGQTYKIRIYSAMSIPGQTTSFNVSITTPPAPPVNDDCSNAITLTVDPYYAQTSTSTTSTLYQATGNILTNSCGTPDQNEDVWFKFVATSSRQKIVTSNITGGIDFLQYSVYKGTCQSLTSVQCFISNGIISNLTPGQTYFIRAKAWLGVSAAPSSFTVTLSNDIPENDSCYTPTIIIPSTLPNCTGGVPGDLRNASPFAIQTCSNGLKDLWYEFTATSDTHYIWFSNVVAPSEGYLKFSLYSGDCSALTVVKCNNYSTNFDPFYTSFVPGQNYKICVTGINSSNISFNICVGTKPSTPPVNNDCTAATTVIPSNTAYCTQPVAGTIAGATNNLPIGQSCGSYNKDVWYTFVATSTKHTISLSNIIGTTTSLNHSVYSNFDCTWNNTTVQCYGNKSTLNYVIGQTYKIRVSASTSYSESSTFNLCITTPVIPANSICANAIQIPTSPGLECTQSINGTTTGASNSSDIGGCTPETQGVWYKFTATSQAHVISCLTSNGKLTSISLFTGNCNNPTLITCGNIFKDLIIGQEYLIRVTRNSDSDIDFSLCVTSVMSITNDECVNAFAIPVNQGMEPTSSTTTNLTTATQSSEALNCLVNTTFRDVWYSFTATRTTHYLLKLPGDTTNTANLKIAFYAGTCSIPSQLYCNIPFTDSKITLNNLIIGQTYRIRIYYYVNFGDPVNYKVSLEDLTFALISPPAPPVNDNCSNPTVLTISPASGCSQPVIGTLTSAKISTDIPSSSGSTYEDVWYQFTATHTTQKLYLSDIIGVGIYGIQVYDGVCGALTFKANYYTSDVISGLTPGTVYNFRVVKSPFGVADLINSFKICLTEPDPAPTNDECSAAVTLAVNTGLTCSTSVNGTLSGATKSTEDASSVQGFKSDVWYTFTATATKHHINITGSYGITHNLYSGSGCGALTYIGYNSVATGLTIGNVYTIRVLNSSWNNNSNDFTICIGTPVTAANDECSNAITLTINPGDEPVSYHESSLQLASFTPITPATGCGTYKDLWYKFTATSTLHYIDISGSYSVLGIYPAADCSSVLCSNAITLKNNYAPGLTIGQTYYIRVQSSSDEPGELHTFRIAITTPQPVINENCANAIVVPVNPGTECLQSYSADLVNTLPSDITICNSNLRDLWVKFTATSTHHIISLGNSSSINYSIFTGDDCLTFNAFCNNPPSIQNLTIGQTYTIRIYTSLTNQYNNFPFELCITTPETCSNPENFVSGYNEYVFAPTNTISYSSGIPCFGGVSNAKWFAVNITNPGDIEYTISKNTQYDPQGDPIGENINYPRYAVWGPFNSAEQGCENLSVSRLIRCSSTEITGKLTLSNAQAGEFYIVLVASFTNGTYIKFEQTGGTASSGNVPAPTGDSNQDFGPGQTLADIEMNDDVTWYDTPGEPLMVPFSNEDDEDEPEVPLPLSTPLVNGTTYYAAKTLYGIESFVRLAVTVNFVEEVPSPTGLVQQDFYAGETLTDLEVNGQNIKWYNNDNAAVPLPANTLLTDGASYSASQTINGLESTQRLTIIVSEITTPAPTGETLQYFETGETLADLEVTGENIKWYATSTSTEELTATTPLADGITYYASQTIDDHESINRLAVTASNQITAITPSPTGAPEQWFSEGETLTDLEVEGENIQWYADASSSLTLSATTLLVDGTTYYASQTVNNTESTERLAITVLLIIVSPPTGASVQTFNNGESLADLEVEGQNIQWYADASSTEPLSEATLLVDGITYYASQTINEVESQDRLAITVFAITPAPTGASEQTFTEGETLADLEVQGENIQWYDNDGEGMPDFPDGTSQPLPLTTLLVDGETYYASQTINGVESSQRLAVNVNLILSNEDFIFKGLRYYPNPANNVLNIENATEINSVSIVNALGQSVIAKTINSTSAQLDVSSLSKGIYFVTVNSGNASKTVKIIKE